MDLPSDFSDSFAMIANEGEAQSTNTTGRNEERLVPIASNANDPAVGKKRKNKKRPISKKPTLLKAKAKLVQNNRWPRRHQKHNSPHRAMIPPMRQVQGPVESRRRQCIVILIVEILKGILCLHRTNKH
jgi:hypothetical protein